jgi:hypothetical protein
MKTKMLTRQFEANIYNGLVVSYLEARPTTACEGEAALFQTRPAAESNPPQFY